MGRVLSACRLWEWSKLGTERERVQCTHLEEHGVFRASKSSAALEMITNGQRGDQGSEGPGFRALVPAERRIFSLCVESDSDSQRLDESPRHRQAKDRVVLQAGNPEPDRPKHRTKRFEYKLISRFSG